MSMKHEEEDFWFMNWMKKQCLKLSIYIKTAYFCYSMFTM